MANIQHKALISVDDHDDWLEVEAVIEFQTTANVLRYCEVVTKEKTGMISRKVGDIVTDLHFGVESANQLKKFLEYLSTYRVEIK